MCVLGVSIFSLFLRFFYWILKLFVPTVWYFIIFLGLIDWCLTSPEQYFSYTKKAMGSHIKSFTVNFKPKILATVILFNLTLLACQKANLAKYYTKFRTIWRVWRYQREVIRIRISKKSRQHNGQKEKDKRTNNDL
jgi:hypothetical protein